MIQRDSDDVPDSSLYAVEKYYKKIPSIVRSHFENDGWVVLVTNHVEDYWNALNSSRAPDMMAGFAASKTMTIYIATRESAYPCVVHEMGHYIDYRVWGAGGYAFRITTDADFIRVYNLELNNFKAYFEPWDHNVSDSKEYWAESFSMFCTDPDGLSANCPNTYNWIVKYYEQ